MKTSEYNTYYTSEIGILEIIGTEAGISRIAFVENAEKQPGNIPESLTYCLTQLEEYFRGTRKKFTLPLLLQGSDFETQVWHELLKIPYGKTRSYADIAERTGRQNAYRAVGNANHKNNISIVIPCHRVIGKSGNLTGYASGLWRKKWLLAHEKAISIRPPDFRERI